MKAYLLDVQSVLDDKNSSVNGLSTQEANKRLEQNGKNKLKDAEHISIFARFLKQLADPMIIILIAAALISGVTSVYSGESVADVIIIMSVVIINSVLGVLQESKAEKAIEALQEISAATSKVIRDGKHTKIRSEDLVVGDIVVLEAGDSVPADCRIVECYSIKAEEAALTGESVPVTKQADKLNVSNEKEVPLGDRANMLYMGSTVVYGRGTAVVVATGMDTEMGKIADAISTAKDEATPLQKKLAQLSKVLTFLVVGISVLIICIDVARILLSGAFVTGESMIDSFMIAVSLAVAAIPEGSVAVITIILSIGVTKMSKRSAVIRKLTAVETLGCTQIICSDKTGTLTQNKMTVVEHISADEKLLMSAMALCCDAKLDEHNEAFGEPTECGLVNDAFKNGISQNDLIKEFPRVAEAPFDSERKMMSTLHQSKAGKVIQYTKGATDEILKCCTHVLTKSGIVEINDALRKEIAAANKAMADKALRVLCAAMKEYNSVPDDCSPEKIENGLCYIGLSGMIDPVRDEVKAAIVECEAAGIRPVMITGDHIDTAIAIAKELNLLKDGEEALTGAMLNKISDEELKRDIAKYSVYARVQPEHKVRIVKAWKENGMITAMTGDGVNDAPSIKFADIGIGMGITGTDVTKNVADMVLADDNFATIVAAIKEGRRIYDNMRKAIQFLLASNLSEVLAIFIATLIGFKILEPAHLLWINLITDSLPALALGLEREEPDIMNRSPRNSKDGIFSGGMGFDIFFQGLMVTIMVLLSFMIGEYLENKQWAFADSADGTTMAFLTLSMTEIFHSLNMRARRASIFKLGHQNKYLWFAMGLSLILTTTVIYVPFLSTAFSFTSISIEEYLIAMGLSVLIIPIMELTKFIQRKIKKTVDK